MRLQGKAEEKERGEEKKRKLARK